MTVASNMSDSITSLHSNSSKSSDEFSKLKRGEAGYGGLFGRPNTPEPGEGLLARKLRAEKDRKLPDASS
jgi:hypothetical protein